jgi:hypothetical protein
VDEGQPHSVVPQHRDLVCYLPKICCRRAATCPPGQSKALQMRC